MAKQAKQEEQQTEQAVTVNLDPTAVLVTLSDQVKAIDEKLTRVSGTMAEWQKKGTEAIQSADLAPFFGGEQTAFSVPSHTTYADYVTRLEEHLSDVKQFGTELRDSWLRAHAPNTDEVAGLRDQRAELVGKFDSYCNVFADMLPNFERPSLPDAPKVGKSSSGGSGGKAKVGKARFYRLVDGKRVYQSDQQHSLSSMAHYHFGKCGVEVLRGGIAQSNGGKLADETKDWEGTVSVNFGGSVRTWTIGWEIVQPASDASDDGKADESASDAS